MKKTCSRGHVFEKSSSCPTCPVCWPGRKKGILAAGDLPEQLGAPALRALDRAKIRSLARLSERTEKEVADLHGMGPKGIGMLKTSMRKIGLSFKKKSR